MKEITEKKRAMIFLCIIISCIANTFLATALATALPAILSDISIDASTGQWLTSGYSLAMGIVMPLTAFLITRFSSKKLYISAICVTIVGLILAAIAQNFEILMIGRIFQAVGNGILAAMAQVLLLSIYPTEKHGSVMGWYGLSINAAPIIAPTIAGVIVDLLNWRAIFIITLVIMVITLIFAIMVFEDVLETKVTKFDMISFVLSAIAFTGVTLGIGNIGVSSFFSFNVLGMLVVGIIALIIFSNRQFKISEPFLDLSVLKNNGYVIAVVSTMLLYMVMMGANIILPIYIQTILEKSATISGLIMLPGSVICMLINPYAGKIYDKIGIKNLYLIGAVAMLGSNLVMCFLTVNTTIWVAIICNTVRNASIAFLMMPVMTWGINCVDSSKKAHASAIISSLRTIAGAIGIAVFVNIMTWIASRGASPMSKEAYMHGADVAYVGMSILSIIMLLIGLVSFRKKSN